MLKHFLESKLIPAWHKLYSRLNTDTVKRVLSVLTILIVSAAVIWGLWRDAQPKEPVPLKDAALVYAQSVNSLNAQSNLYYRVDGTIALSVGSNTIEETFTQLTTLESRQSDQSKICVEETCHIGDYEIKRFDFFSDGKEFLSIQDVGIQADISREDFSEKFIPPVLLDPKLYYDITGITTREASTITFSSPIATESWLHDDATIISAEGTVQLDDGMITSSSYTVTYTLGDAEVTANYALEIVSTEFSPIQLPDTSNYTSIVNIDSAYILEKACGYLMSLNNIQTEYADEIACQAFGDVRNQSIQMEISQTDDWTVLVDTVISTSNSSKTGTTTSTKTEEFKEGIYTASTDGGEFIENLDVNQTSMNSYCQNLLIGTIMLPQYIATTELTESETQYTFTFQATEEYAQILAEDACTLLYQSATILTDLAEASSTDVASCYLTIDKNVGIPIAAGFHYQGTYSISGIPYQLSFKADQSYTMPQ